jgi:PKD repeat protein
MERPSKAKDGLKVLGILVVSMMLFYSSFLADRVMAENVSKITIIVASQSAAEPQESTEPTSTEQPPPPYVQEENRPPVADAGGPYKGYVDQTIVFNASNSYDPDGEIIGYRWDLDNDGLYDTKWLTEPIVVHVYTKTGNYTIKLQVKDNNNTVSNDTTIVRITTLEEKILPIPIINAPNISFSNQDITFDASSSYDKDGKIVNYTWKFENKSILYGIKVNFSYLKAGKKSVILKVMDNDNLTNSTLFIINIISKIEELNIKNTTHYLVDTDGDNQIDAFYNSTSNSIIVIDINLDGGYLIDEDNDGAWDYVYYLEQKKLVSYKAEKSESKSTAFPVFMLIFSVIIVLGIVIVVCALAVHKKNHKKRKRSRRKRSRKR